MNNFRKAVVSAALMGGAVVGGAVGASMIGTANAQTTTDSTSSSAPATAPATGDHAPHGNGAGGPHSANGITEQLLTGDDLTKATDAANAAVPGATIDRAETDAEGAAFEVHMTKADGSRVTVKLDADFSVANVEDGM
jgi:uncharacterized membrane protein YkoI